MRPPTILVFCSATRVTSNQAPAWLGRAAKKYDGDANLAIAKIYLESKNDKNYNEVGLAVG